MGFFDSSEEHPSSKIRRYIIMLLAFIILAAGGLWYLLRFHTEKATIRHFLNAVVAGNTQQAYQIWKPSPSYSFKDFLEDWGPDGYYGPIRSFHMEDTEHLRNGSGIVVTLEVSPYQPYPDDNDMAKQSKSKKVKLWVEFKDESISFPPY